MAHKLDETAHGHAGGTPLSEPSPEPRSLFRARSGRYFGGLWFKVFSERGPC